MTITGTGLGVSSSDGRYYGRVIIAETSESYRVVPDGVDTGSVAVRAYNVEEEVYLGWDDEVDADEGFPLGEDEAITIDLNSNSQGLWVTSDTQFDEVRVIATN